MPASPIIVFGRDRGKDQNEVLTKALIAEKYSSGFANISDMLNKGIAAYQDLKNKKRDQDLASISAAGALVGGMDKLPPEVKNKLPGILGMDMARDSQGNVLITPSAKDLIDRATKDALAKDPEGFARVQAGIQEKAPDPQQMQLAKDKQAADEKANALNAKVKILENETKIWETKFNSAAQDQRTHDEIQGRKDVAGQTAKTKAEEDARPSGMFIDNKTGEVMSEPAARMKLDLAEKFEDRFWQPSNQQLTQYNNSRTSQARVDRARSQNQLDAARANYMQEKIKLAGSKNDELKYAVQMLRSSRLAKNETSIKFFENEIKNILGKEVEPSYYQWALDHWDDVMGYVDGWFEGQTGRGGVDNAAKTPASGGPPTTIAPMKAGGQQAAPSGAPAQIKRDETGAPVVDVEDWLK